MRSLLGQDRTTFEGDVFTITDAPCDPAPIQSPLPILVGTGSPRMLRITARFADEWNTWGGPSMAGGARAKFTAACESVERDPASMWTSVQALVFVTNDEAEAETILAGPMGSRSIAGTPDRLVEIIGEYTELGFDEFIVPDWNLGDEPGPRREAFERIDEQVVAQLR